MIGFLNIYQNFLLSIIAIFFSIGAIFLISKSKYNLKYLFLFLLFFILVINSFYIYLDNFTGNGLDLAFWYHFQFGSTGIKNSVIFKTIKENLPLTFKLIIILVIFLVFWKIIGKKLTYNRAFVFLFFSILFSKIFWDSFFLYKLLDTDSEKNNNFYSYYRIPNLDIIGDSNKNLIYIYLESFENTLLDKPEFFDLAPHLKEIKKNYTYFSNIHEDFGMMRTIAGMVASQCGIPLIGGNSLVYSKYFLPKAVCLGDILKAKGYYNVYIGGANLAFAGKGKFYKTHGFDEVLGFDELRKNFKNKNIIHWGYSDNIIMDFFFKKYIELKKKKKKFSLFTITLNTHDEGFIEKNCKKRIKFSQKNYKKIGDYPILDAFACDDYIIGNLIDRLIKAGALEDSIIVIQSDHYVMGISSISKYIRKNYKFSDRGITFIILDKNGSKIINKKGLTIDIGATVLSAMGFKVNYLGLGRNLYNKNIKTLFEKAIDLKKFVSDLALLNSLPKFSKIIVKNNKAILGNASFPIPIYLEFNKNWGLKSFVIHPYLLKKIFSEYKNYNKNFILINSCEFWSKSGDICYVKNNKFYYLNDEVLKFK